MDFSGLLPGLVQLLEDRLGRFGYWLGTCVILSITLCLMLAPFLLLLAIFNITWNVSADTAFAYLYLPLYIVMLIVCWIILYFAGKGLRKANRQMQRGEALLEQATNMEAKTEKKLQQAIETMEMAKEHVEFVKAHLPVVEDDMQDNKHN